MPITYDVERDGVIVSTGLTEAQLDDTGLTAGTEYDYRVRAVDEFGVGPWSETLTVTTTSAALFSDDFTYSDGTLVRL